MRILFVTQVPLDRAYGGARHVLAVARELAKRGHVVRLLAPGRDEDPRPLAGTAGSVERLRPPAHLTPGARLEAALAGLAVREVLRARPDVAYVRLSASSSLVPLALDALGVPVVLELNGRILDELRGLGRGAARIAVVRTALRDVVARARALVAVEPDIGRHAEVELGAQRVFVIENGADLDAAIPGDRGEARRALGLDPSAKLLAFTGTLVPEQRLDRLLEALEALPEITLLVAGGGPQAATLEARARIARPGAVVPLGVVPHATALQVIRAADVCVNVRDGDLGMKAFEYAALGRRMVLFRGAGVERLTALYPGLEAVHLADARSAPELARAIRTAFEAEARLGPLPPSAIEAARRTIGWDHTARRIEAVLQAEVRPTVADATDARRAPRPWRVVLVTNGLTFGGAERVVQAIAEHLQDRGHAVRVVATTRDGPIGDALRARGIAVDVLGLAHAFDARVPLALARIVRAHRADLVHSHIAISDLASLLAHPLSRRARLVSTVHSAYVELDPRLRAAWHASLSLFDRVLAVSEAARSSLPPALEVEVVPVSLVDPADPTLDRAEARRRLGLRGDTPLVLAIGRLVPVKGFDVLAAASDRLTTPGVQVLLIGDGPEHARLTGHPRLVLAGGRADAGALVSAADVVVLPSRSEGLPQVALHAMAAGIPVVATRVGGTPEVVREGETGLLVPPEDPEALARALDLLLRDRTRAEALGHAGRRRLIESDLTRGVMLERLRAVYEALISGRPGERP